MCYIIYVNLGIVVSPSVLQYYVLIRIDSLWCSMSVSYPSLPANKFCHSSVCFFSLAVSLFLSHCLSLSLCLSLLCLILSFSLSVSPLFLFLPSFSLICLFFSHCLYSLSASLSPSFTHSVSLSHSQS